MTAVEAAQTESPAAGNESRWSSPPTPDGEEGAEREQALTHRSAGVLTTRTEQRAWWATRSLTLPSARR
jgi:hypothetical protein